MKEELVEKTIRCLYNAGLPLLYEGKDIDFSVIDIDSIQFAACIVELENCFSIELPDEFLAVDSMTSLYSLVQLVDELMS